MSTTHGPDPSWQPGLSPWERILPHFERTVRIPQGGGFFSGLRDFVIAAASSPVLQDRYVYPSTIALTIFKTSQPVERFESPSYSRVVLSPKPGYGKLTLRYFGRTDFYDRGPHAEWIGSPAYVIEIIRKLFADRDV
jgi:hypothetical protein